MTSSRRVKPQRRNSWPRYDAPPSQYTATRKNTLQTVAFAGVGISYSISEKELVVLQSTRLHHSDQDWRTLALPISQKAAYARLEASAHSGWTQCQREARKRLCNAYHIPWQEQTPDLFIKIFNDLDLVLFHGLLRDRVLLRWDNVDLSLFPKVVAEGGVVAGYTSEPLWLTQHIERTLIVLNISVFKHYNREATWGTLIHEMLHAYLYISTACPANEQKCAKTRHASDPSHGPLFERSCNALAWRLGFEGMVGNDLLACGAGNLGIVVPVEWDRVTDVVVYYSGEVPREVAEYMERFERLTGGVEQGKQARRRRSLHV